MTQNEAFQLIQSIQSTLNAISLDVTNRDGAKALADTCEVRADYFNSGLHEFVFGPGQTSGTEEQAGEVNSVQDLLCAASPYL
ncbi:hypothetical protein LTR17_003031 [Elasticomyces elasticus]|nr:hypothetical protein LTR17_003031 [Elasticomyces elasticus]